MCSPVPTTSRCTCRPTPQTRRLVNAERLAKATKGLRIVNTARGDLIDEAALADAIEAGQVAGAGLDVFDKEPTVDHRLQMLPQVVATPHIAASTREGQELVGVETAPALRDFLKRRRHPQRGQLPVGLAEEFKRLQPFVELGERLGTFLAQMNEHRVTGVSSGTTESSPRARPPDQATRSWPVFFKPMLSTGITLVNAASVATARGIEVVESRSNADAQLHQPDVRKASHQPRRTLGRRRRARAHDAAARPHRRRGSRGRRSKAR